METLTQLWTTIVKILRTYCIWYQEDILHNTSTSSYSAPQYYSSHFECGESLVYFISVSGLHEEECGSSWTDGLGEWETVAYVSCHHISSRTYRPVAVNLLVMIYFRDVRIIFYCRRTYYDYNKSDIVM